MPRMNVDTSAWGMGWNSQYLRGLVMRWIGNTARPYGKKLEGTSSRLGSMSVFPFLLLSLFAAAAVHGIPWFHSFCMDYTPPLKSKTFPCTVKCLSASEVMRPAQQKWLSYKSWRRGGGNTLGLHTWSGRGRRDRWLRQWPRPACWRAKPKPSYAVRTGKHGHNIE